ncbi:MAG: capsule biosynthesis protein [Spirochaetes bacterium GWF1_41_5]|nr:MAG: capsule biosynthesis protein [Spirochaetes bacterium GWF1_41_5]
MNTVKLLQRARDILKAEARAIENIPLDDNIVMVSGLFLKCRGKVILSGMGKAGHIAQKLAGTLSSTGTPSVFLHPGESEHGDLGVITSSDLLMVFSNSGKTREIAEMIVLARRLGLKKVIAVTSHAESPIRSLSDIILDIGPISEPCPLGLTPTASTAAMLALGDALALITMEARGFTRKDYGLRHHGGYLGSIANR